MISRNVVAFGARGDGLRDDTASIINAIGEVRRAGGGEVLFPPGAYRLTGPLPAYSRISYRGAGMSLSTLHFQGKAYNGFVDGEGASGDNPMTDTAWCDLGLDGSALAAAPGKGIYVQHMRHPRWRAVLVRGFPSTGFGADFLHDGVFELCRAEGNGRLEEVDDPGGAGIGVGVGASSVEHSLVLGCSCLGNRTWGVFFELQKGSTPGRRSVGSRVMQSYLASNGFGVGDAGLAGLEVSDCTIVGNAFDGVTVNHGSGEGLGAPGQGGLIAENIIEGNGRHGIWLDYTDQAGGGPGGYVVRNNIVARSGKSGILLSVGHERVRDIRLIGNELADCGGPGIYCTAGTAELSDLVVRDNRSYRNGTSDRRAQIRLSGPMSRPRLLDNVVYGNDVRTDIGIDLEELASADALVTGNDVHGAGIQLGPRVGGVSRVEGNPGDQPAPPQLLDHAASPIIHRAGLRPEDVYVSGGTDVVARLDGTVLFVGPGVVRLNPGETLALSWLAAPRVTVRTLG